MKKSKMIEPVKSKNPFTEILVQPNPSLFENLQFTSRGIKEKSTEISERLPKLNLIMSDEINKTQ